MNKYLENKFNPIIYLDYSDLYTLGIRNNIPKKLAYKGREYKVIENNIYTLKIYIKEMI